MKLPRANASSVPLRAWPSNQMVSLRSLAESELAMAKAQDPTPACLHCKPLCNMVSDRSCNEAKQTDSPVCPSRLIAASFNVLENSWIVNEQSYIKVNIVDEPARTLDVKRLYNHNAPPVHYPL